MYVSVIVVAAGCGRRFGYERNKLFYPLAGRPVLSYTLEHVLAASCVDELIVVTSQADRQDIKAMTEALEPRVPVHYVDGGAERQESVYAGLLACNEQSDVVMVHDGARPWAGPEWFDQALEAMERGRAAIYAIPLKDTVKERLEGDSGAGQRIYTLDRSRLLAVQTPQIFHRDLLLAAYDHARQEQLAVTDDSSLVEALGEKVIVLAGDERNRKVTTRDDIPVLELYMGCSQVPRIGFGYDVHQLVTGRRLVLGGVDVPYKKGLDGHSDADVLIHAVMDALLGAAGLRDIGTYFPDTDPRYKGISSLKLLEQVGHLLFDKSCRIVNIDVTLMAQRPKIALHVPKMIENLAAVLRLPLEAVSVKATTTEHLGFVGRGEGMAAQAAALVTISRMNNF